MAQVFAHIPHQWRGVAHFQSSPWRYVYLYILAARTSKDTTEKRYHEKLKKKPPPPPTHFPFFLSLSIFPPLALCSPFPPPYSKIETQLWQICNMGSNTYFNLEVEQHGFTVVETDGSMVWKTYELNELFFIQGWGGDHRQHDAGNL